MKTLLPSLAILTLAGCNASTNSRPTDKASAHDVTVTVDEDSKDDFVTAEDSSQIGGTNLTSSKTKIKKDLRLSKEPSTYHLAFFDHAKSSTRKSEKTTVKSWPLRFKVPTDTTAILYIDDKPAYYFAQHPARSSEASKMYWSISKTARQAGEIGVALTSDSEFFRYAPTTDRVFSVAGAVRIAQNLQARDSLVSDSAKLLIQHAKHLESEVKRSQNMDELLATGPFDYLFRQRTLNPNAANEVIATASQLLYAANFNQPTQETVDVGYYISTRLKEGKKSFFAAYSESIKESEKHFEDVLRRNAANVPASKDFYAQTTEKARTLFNNLLDDQPDGAIQSFKSPLLTTAKNFKDINQSDAVGKSNTPGSQQNQTQQSTTGSAEQTPTQQGPQATEEPPTSGYDSVQSGPAVPSGSESSTATGGSQSQIGSESTTAGQTGNSNDFQAIESQENGTAPE